ncbi:hypothetical protein WMF18_25005 [Sorangium sp. So ce315]|uniref:hypothetical protein n=1 Tax=Sorangium sp. So ce315 TaxID=3133299 RepID=UPI003F5F1D3B
MNKATSVIALLVASVSSSIVGCAADVADVEVEESTSLAPGQETRGQADYETMSATADAACPPGYVYLDFVNACVAYPYTINTTPGYAGCTHGAVISAYGKVFCLPFSTGFRARHAD